MSKMQYQGHTTLLTLRDMAIAISGNISIASTEDSILLKYSPAYVLQLQRLAKDLKNGFALHLRMISTNQVM